MKLFLKTKCRLVYFFFGICCCGLNAINAQVAVTATLGTATANYTSVNNAFGAINNGIHQGNIVITVTGTTIEIGTPTPLLKSAFPSNYSSILIRPSGDATIYADTSIPVARAVLELVGADNVTINGDDPNTPGKQNLTITLEPTSKALTAAISLGSKSFGSDNGDSNIVIKNCNIIGGRTNASTNIYSYGISFTNNMLVPTITWSGFTTSFAHSHRNITIDSNNIKKAYYGIYAASNDTFPSKNIVITNNFIGSDIGSDAIGCMGIFVSNTCDVQGAASAIIEGNDITVGDGLTGGITNLHVMGIMVYEGNHGIQIRKNNIHDILHIPSSSGAWGIAIQGVNNTSINIVNNFIRDVAAGENIATVGNVHFGNHGIYAFGNLIALTLVNNTIVLNKQNSGGNGVGNPISSCLYFAGTGARPTIIANNIFVNNQQSNNAYNILATGASVIDSAMINNNAYYSNTGYIGFYGFGGISNLATWQSATQKDAASVNIAPSFVSPSDLHIVGASQTALESGGLPTSITHITTDIDNETRPGPTGSVYGGGSLPDIGADEFDGIIADGVAPLIMYTALGKTCDNLDRTLSNAMISDATGINLTGSLVPRIYFSKNGGNWYSNAGTLVSGNKFQSYWNFTITSTTMGGVNANDNISYYVIAQDITSATNISSLPIGAIASNVNQVSSSPTNTNGYLVGKSLGGIYTVGVGGNYPTITDAINAYHASCLNSNVVFSLINADYSTENFPIVINQHPDAAPNKTLTIKPAAGNTVTMTSSGTAASVFNLNGADYITIDGSNNGTNSRDFSITNASSPATVILFTSIGAGKGATHNTLKNLIVNGGDYNVRYNVGIDLSGADNDNNIVQNCTVNNTYVGISALNTTNNMMDSTQIINNVIGAGNVNSIGFHGIEISSVTATKIVGNTIRNLYTGDFRFVTGIDIGAKSTNINITKNDISGIVNDYGSGWGAFGISVTSSNAVSDIFIANNFISKIITNVPSPSSANANAHGIRLLAGINTKIYHNSINMVGGPSSANTGFSSCILILTAATNGLEIKNNILSNTEAFTGNGSKNYCMYASVTGVSFASIDYNDYYGATTATSSFVTGYNGGSDKVNLADWANFSGGDAHSIAAAPDFITDVDLHMVSGNTSLALESAAQLISNVPTDIDGDSRPGPSGSLFGGALAGRADMGADEFDRKPILCQVPIGVTISNVTITSATINFTAPAIAPSNGYEYVIVTANAIPTTAGTPIATTTINTTTLQDDMTYYVFVRSVCGNGNYSDWSSVTSFKTNCLAYNLPYYENFDGVTAPLPAACMKIEDINTSGSTWFTRVPWIFGEPGQQIAYTTNTASAANNWFYLPGLNLTGGQQYMLGFKYLMTSSFATEKMKVAFGLNNTASAMTTVIFDSANIKNKNFYYRPQVTFTPATTGIYYLGFNVYSAANQSWLFVDSITVNATTVPVKLDKFSGYKEGTKNVLNWTTLTEINNKGFAIERSVDGSNFTQIAFINSIAKDGISSQTLNYLFNDSKPFNGNNYYRLKQIDINGKFEYSSIVKINNSTNLQIVAVYPNPASNILNININANSNAVVDVLVTDIIGKIITSKKVQTTAGTNNTSIDISKLAVGTYLVKMITDGLGETNISKFIKQ